MLEVIKDYIFYVIEATTDFCDYVLEVIRDYNFYVLEATKDYCDH